MKKIVTWVVVADAQHARFFQNEGPGKGLHALPGALSGIKPPGRDIMADRPGRSFDSAGIGRHAMVPRTDPREVEQQKFVHEIAAVLEQGAQQQSYGRLVLVASPKVLGELRQVLSPHVMDLVTGELDKDLTKIPERDLPDRLGAVMAV